MKLSKFLVLTSAAVLISNPGMLQGSHVPHYLQKGMSVAQGSSLSHGQIAKQPSSNSQFSPLSSENGGLAQVSSSLPQRPADAQTNSQELFGSVEWETLQFESAAIDLAMVSPSNSSVDQPMKQGVRSEAGSREYCSNAAAAQPSEFDMAMDAIRWDTLDFPESTCGKPSATKRIFRGQNLVDRSYNLVVPAEQSQNQSADRADNPSPPAERFVAEANGIVKQHHGDKDVVASTELGEAAANAGQSYASLERMQDSSFSGKKEAPQYGAQQQLGLSNKLSVWWMPKKITTQFSSQPSGLADPPGNRTADSSLTSTQPTSSLAELRTKPGPQGNDGQEFSSDAGFLPPAPTYAVAELSDAEVAVDAPPPVEDTERDTKVDSMVQVDDTKEKDTKDDGVLQVEDTRQFTQAPADTAVDAVVDTPVSADANGDLADFVPPESQATDFVSQDSGAFTAEPAAAAGQEAKARDTQPLAEDLKSLAEQFQQVLARVSEQLAEQPQLQEEVNALKSMKTQVEMDAIETRSALERERMVAAALQSELQQARQLQQSQHHQVTQLSKSLQTAAESMTRLNTQTVEFQQQLAVAQADLKEARMRQQEAEIELQLIREENAKLVAELSKVNGAAAVEQE